MSTNNNRLGKEIQPAWKNEQAKTSQMSAINADKLSRLVNNDLSKITALSLSDRGVKKIENFQGMSSLCRLDLSHNQVKRIQGMVDISRLGMLNISSNELENCEDLKYLTEIRTLNIGGNPKIKRLESHIMKPLHKLQALIANECGFKKASFIRFLPNLNTLILSKNELSLFPTSSCLLRHLTKLSLNGNMLDAIPDLVCCPMVQELRINHNNITTIQSSILDAKHIKLLDISSNKLTNWSDVELLSRLPLLTNLCIHSNAFPPPPSTFDNVVLREDISMDKIKVEKRGSGGDKSSDVSNNTDFEVACRRHILCQFQKYVGVENKPKVQLIVLDMKRVKSKWSHHTISGTSANNEPFSASDGEKYDIKEDDVVNILSQKRKRDTGVDGGDAGAGAGAAGDSSAQVINSEEDEIEKKKKKKKKSESTGVAVAGGEERDKGAMTGPGSSEEGGGRGGTGTGGASAGAKGEKRRKKEKRSEGDVLDNLDDDVVVRQGGNVLGRADVVKKEKKGKGKGGKSSKAETSRQDDDEGIGNTAWLRSRDEDSQFETGDIDRSVISESVMLSSLAVKTSKDISNTGVVAVKVLKKKKDDEKMDKSDASSGLQVEGKVNLLLLSQADECSKQFGMGGSSAW